MATFSRGLGPRIMLLVRQQAPCKCAAPPTPLVFRARFSISRLLQKKVVRPSRSAAKPTAAPKPTPRPSPAARTTPLLNASAKATTGPAAVRPSTYAQQIALRGRTLLYEAPSHFWFRAGCFSSATFCISYSVYNYWAMILHPPQGLDWWVPHAFGVILIFMAGMGTFFIMGAGRVIRTIEAVPAAAVAKKLLSEGAAANLAESPVLVEFTAQRMAPFMPAKKMVFAPDEVLMPFRMHTVFAGAEAQRPMSFAEKVRAERAEREAGIAARKYTMDHIMTAPFRDAGNAFSGAFAGIRRSFNREGFAKINLGKKSYKLDVTGAGWALDKGRAMDRLLQVRPNALR